MGVAMQTSSRKVAAVINVTPMIDILLVLLIAFMLLPDRSHGLPSDVPEPAGERSAEVAQVLDLTPAYVKGIINLRGKVIPVVDLRLKFKMPAAEYSQRTCIIVVDVAGDASRMLMGIVVDAVSEVLNIQPGDIETTPDFGEGVSIPYLLGIAKCKGKVKILLDIDKVLTAHELNGLDKLIG